MARPRGGRAPLRDRRVERDQIAHRRRSRHHQRPGPDQHQGGRLFAARIRAAHHLSDRDRDRGHPEPQLYQVDLALWPEPGHCRLRGRDRHLFRAPAGQRAAPGRARTASTRDGARNGPDLDGSRRNLHVLDRGRTGRAKTRRHALYGGRPPDDVRLGHPAADAHDSGGRRDQHDRRLRPPISCDPEPGLARLAQSLAQRCRHRTRGQ